MNAKENNCVFIVAFILPVKMSVYALGSGGDEFMRSLTRSDMNVVFLSLER